MLFLNSKDGGPLQARIFYSSFTLIVFWVMMIFALSKLYVACMIKEMFKPELMGETGDIE